MSRVLIDTHCHVHASLVDISETAENGCCDASMQTETNISGEGSRDARDDLPYKGDKDKDSSAADRPMNLHPLPEVVHVTMGIKEDDWPGAVRFAAATRDVAADSLRHAHSRSDGWLQNLKALLEEHPQALVGEIGLDKVARTPETRRVEWNHQLEVFRAQMALAAELSRPVSVHCVKAYGKVVDFLRDAHQARSESSRGSRPRKGHGGPKRSGGESGGDVGGLQGHRVEAGGGGGGGDDPLECEAGRPPGGGRDLTRDRSAVERRISSRLLPPRIALHSFTGSVEVAEDITRIAQAGEGGVEVYFGFSAAVNMRGDRETKRLTDVLSVVPDSRVLVETDRRVPVAAADELLRVCGAIAEAKGISVAEAVALANRNAALFLAEL